MNSETRFRLLISSLVASQMFAQQPVIAHDGGLGTINGYLAAMAAKNGVMYTDASSPVRMGAPVLPSRDDFKAAVRNLPKPVAYPEGLPTPDPTPDEALTLVPPVTDVQQVLINGKLIDPIFGTVTQADETLTGLFEDLSVVDLTDAQPQPDPSMFDINTDAEGNTILPPTAYDILAPVLSDDERALAIRTVALTKSIGLLENRITVDPIAGLQIAPGKSQAAPDETQGEIAMLALPAVPFGGIGETMPSVAVQADGTTHGIMLKGFVQESVDGTNFFHVDAAPQEIQLASGHQITARKGSLLWLDQDDPAKVCVKSASHGVRVSLNHGLQLDLAPGEELVWARDAQDAVACLKDGVSRRNVRRHLLPDGSCLIVSEFSILHHLSKQNDPTVLPYRERMLKTIAALNVACRHHGRYRAVPTAG